MEAEWGVHALWFTPARRGVLAEPDDQPFEDRVCILDTAALDIGQTSTQGLIELLAWIDVAEHGVLRKGAIVVRSPGDKS
jgi:hypothetical protein